MKRVLVIGSGPAGTACAWKLASSGVPCILADRAEFPRAKICGGALSHRASEVLISSGMLSGDELDDLTVAVHDTMTITRDMKDLRTSSGHSPPIRLADRREFDSFLRRRALEAGAEPVNDEFVDISGGTALFSSGRRIAFERIVGADGASSTVRRKAFSRRPSKQCPSLSTVIQLSPRAVEPFQERGLHVFFFRELYGYGWLFPRKDDIIVGVGSFRKPHPDLRKLLGRILRHSGLSPDGEPSGALLPAGRQPVNTGSGKVLLAGDAAGLCDRITGEGIASALESGCQAASAIVSGVDHWNRNSETVRRIRKSLRLRKYLYARPFRYLAMKALADGDRWYSRYWSIVAGSCDYGHLFRN